MLLEHVLQIAIDILLFRYISYIYIFVYPQLMLKCFPLQNRLLQWDYNICLRPSVIGCSTVYLVCHHCSPVQMQSVWEVVLFQFYFKLSNKQGTITVRLGGVLAGLTGSAEILKKKNLQEFGINIVLGIIQQQVYLKVVAN